MVNGVEHVLKYGPRNGFVVFFATAFLPWFAGIVLLASPFWWLLHRYNKRGWMSAVGLGFVLAFLVTLALLTRGFDLIPATEGSTFSASDNGGPTWINNELTTHGWVQAFWSSFWFGLAGICSALATWRVAYRFSRQD